MLSSDPVVSSGAQAWSIQILRWITRITESLFDIIEGISMSLAESIYQQLHQS